MRKEDQYVQKPQPSYQGGSRITVEPIRDPKDIETIKRLLKDRPRDLLLLTMGINNGLRVGDLLKFKAGQVRHMKPGQSNAVREGKTGKVNVLMVNWSAFKVLQRYLEVLYPAAADLFKSAKGKNQPITTSSVNNLIKSWCRVVNRQGNYGAHTLRKTFGYIQRTQFGVGFEVLAKQFNQPNTTLDMGYLGVTDAELNGTAMVKISYNGETIQVSNLKNSGFEDHIYIA